MITHIAFLIAHFSGAFKILDFNIRFFLFLELFDFSSSSLMSSGTTWLADGREHGLI